MRVGVFTPLLSQMPLEDVLRLLGRHSIRTVELGTGNYPGDSHCKLSMLEDEAALRTFRSLLDKHGFSISALSSHGNPLHPDAQRAHRDRDIGRRAILLAEKLGVQTVRDFAGCPGDSPNARGQTG